MDQKTPKQLSKPRKRRWRIAVALGALAVVAAIVFWPDPKEPEYQGKKLSEWVRPYGNGFLRTAAIGRDEVIRTNANAGALRAMGSNAVPMLLKWTVERTSRWRSQAATVIKKMPAIIRGNSYVRALINDETESRANAAIWGFWVLGPEARSAVPALTKMAYTTDASESTRAIRALGCIGKEGFVPNGA